VLALGQWWHARCSAYCMRHTPISTATKAVTATREALTLALLTSIVLGDESDDDVLGWCQCAIAEGHGHVGPERMAEFILEARAS